LQNCNTAMQHHSPFRPNSSAGVPNVVAVPQAMLEQSRSRVPAIDVLSAPTVAALPVSMRNLAPVESHSRSAPSQAVSRFGLSYVELMPGLWGYKTTGLGAYNVLMNADTPPSNSVCTCSRFAPFTCPSGTLVSERQTGTKAKK